MTKRVVLDAMIKRADFAVQSEPTTFELGSSIKLNELSNKNPVSKLLRKPDFQRETNHWSPNQVAGLVASFARGELIPTVILWKSDSFIFVIDGGHRLSALRAWMENDYGDGPISGTYFSQNIPEEQRIVARQTRKMVEAVVGRYSDLVNLTEDQLEANPGLAKIHSTIFSRALHVQWVPGDQEVAETSFFKINSQGTVLDQTEELLLKNRRTCYAIGARSIIRAATGHKYWSSFRPEIQSEIESLSVELNDLLFQPNASEPIKTLDLPLGGTSSPIEALKILVDIFSIIDGEIVSKKKISTLQTDTDGTETIALLKRALRVIRRLTGNDGSSLGLHPAVYFYTEQGKHSRFLFLGLLDAASLAIRNNNKEWFKQFTLARSALEKTLIERKALINQALANVNSGQRIGRISTLLRFLVEHFQKSDVIEDKEIVTKLGLEGTTGNLKLIEAPTGFSTDVKSAMFLQTAITTAPRCSVCKGLLHAIKSVSYDHINPKVTGGRGAIENGQLLHPFCNTGIKGGGQ